MLKGTGDRCSFSSVCGTMFRIAYRGVSIHTNVDITNMFECRVEGAILVPEKKFNFLGAPIQKAPE